MASRTKTRTNIKRGALKQGSRHLDCLSSQTAQILRMRYRISADDEDVGEPSDECSLNIRQRIMAIEKSVIERACGKVSIQSAPKQKIIQALREKN
jgi:hypothetical protein